MKNIIEFIKSNDINARQRIEEDNLKYLIYNGRLREVILQQIMREFKDDETITELSDRIVPINIIRKCIDKLAKVYKNDPIRRPIDLNPADQDLIDMYSRSFNVNQYMQYANQLFKLHKQVLVEPYLNKKGEPKIRTVPSQSFWLFSDDSINPEKMTKVVKLLKDAEDDKDKLFAIWTDEEHWIIDGRGEVVSDRMMSMNNKDGRNPYGVLPFIHINDSIDMLYPVRPTDMLSIQSAICLLLSDSALAQKYLSWGTLTIIGGEGEQKIKVGPKATIQIPIGVDGTKPEVKYLQPNLNSDEVLRLVDKLVEYLLSTNNLSAASISGGINTSNASGISKMLDEVTSTEDKEEQRKIFENAEKNLWDLFAHKMLPVWNDSNQINTEYKGAFSPDFELDIFFKDMKPMLTEKEQVELIISKLNSGLLTMKGALKELNPSMSDEGILELINEIQDEKLSNFEAFQMPEANEEIEEEEEDGDTE